MEKLGELYQLAQQRPWSEYEQLIESLAERDPMYQFVVASLVAYSPRLDDAVDKYQDHRLPEIRLCVLTAVAEKSTAEGRKLDDRKIKILRELTKAEDVIVAARALLSLIVVTAQIDPPEAASREKILKRLNAIEKKDVLIRDLVTYLSGDLPKSDADQQGDTEIPTKKSESKAASE